MNENVATALYLLHEVDEPLTTSDVAKIVFRPDDDEELRNAERKVRYYFEEGYSYLTEVSENDDGAATYTAVEGRVWVGEGVMHVAGGDEIVEIGFGDVLVYEDEDGVPQTVHLATGDSVPSDSLAPAEESDF
jgi:hypothetical protein